MRVYTPGEVAKHAGNKYLGVLVAAKFARVLNEFPRDRSLSGEKKLTTRALEDLSGGATRYSIVPPERSSRARVGSFFSPLSERSRGNSFRTRANFAATGIARYVVA